MGLFKDIDLKKEEAVLENPTKSAEIINSFFTTIGKEFGSYNISMKYIDVLYIIDKRSFKWVSRNYKGDYNSNESSYPETVEEVSLTTNCREEDTLFDTVFRIVNGHIKQTETPSFIPRIYIIPSDSGYFDEEDPKGILLEPVFCTELIKISPLEGHNRDNVYKVNSIRLSNSDYIKYLIYTRNTIDEEYKEITDNIASFGKVVIGSDTSFVTEKENNNFIMIADSNKEFFSDNGTKDILFNIVDKINTGRSSNYLINSIPDLIGIKKSIYAFTRNNLYTPPIDYSMEQIGVYNIVLTDCGMTTYLIEIGKDKKRYRSKSYIEEDKNNISKDPGLLYCAKESFILFIKDLRRIVEIFSLIAAFITLSVIIYIILIPK